MSHILADYIILELTL